MKYLSFLVFLSLFGSTTAAPNGASACPGGMAAVGAPHFRQGATTNGTLAEGGVSLTIGDTTLAAGDKFEAAPGERFSLTVVAANAPFRGILVRLECQTDLSGALSTWSLDLLQGAAACAQDDNFVDGMTHTSNVDKSVVEMEIGLDTVTTVSMDVTVVMANTASEGSIFTYDRFFFVAKHAPCNICGGDLTIGNTEGIIPVPPEFGVGVESIDCATAAQLGMAGQIAPALCSVTPALTTEICQCGVQDGSDAPNEEVETGEPMETMEPTVEPTAAATAKLPVVRQVIVVWFLIGLAL